MTVLNEGRPVFADGDDDRIGRGPWARWLATSVVPDESSPRAERGRILARTGHVHSVSVVEGTVRVAAGSGTSSLLVSAGNSARDVDGKVELQPMAAIDIEHAAVERLDRGVQLAHGADSVAVPADSIPAPRRARCARMHRGTMLGK